MRRRRRRLAPGIAAIAAAVVAWFVYFADQRSEPVRNIESLIDPAKIATLRGNRAANDRLLKAIYWMDYAAKSGEMPEQVAADSSHAVYVNRQHAELVKRSLVRNLKIASELGCLTEENLVRLRRGTSPIISRGPYAGQEAEVDHIVPVAVAPQWMNEIANLELLPRELNRKKGATTGARQEAVASELRSAGL